MAKSVIGEWVLLREPEKFHLEPSTGPDQLEMSSQVCYITRGRFAASRFSSLSGALMCDSK